MAKFILRFSKKVSVYDWNTIEKALSHKYLKKIATGNPKRPWYYIYNETFLKPFTALKDLFGLSEKRISNDYAQNDIKKDYGVDKKTFAAHVLEFFTNKDKWNTLFRNKADRDKNKKPVTQKKVEQAFKERASKNGEKVKEPKRIINRSLMRKVWTIYSVEGQRIDKAESEQEKHDNRSNAMKGNKNAEKNGVYTDNLQGVENGKDNTDTGREVLSAGTEKVRSGRSEETGGKNVHDTGAGDNAEQSSLGIVQSGIGLGNADGDVNRERGRVTKGQARKIRKQCREILKKPDGKITEADKAILSQYVGAGGTDEEGSSNSGVLYEFYTPRNVISKVWELVDKYNPRQDKTVIEPSSGIGRFAEGRSEKFTMFELEEDSARIAHILHPDAEIVQGAFQENFMKNKKGRFTKDFEKYDVAVGNPPYGAYTGKYKGMGEGKDYKRYESYFMSRTLDTVKDGGIMAMVVPSGFLNGGSSYGKDLEKISEKAELLEAWRLPNGTFDSTDVGTDIVVFRKGKGTTVDALKNYFANNPDHIAGEVSARIGRFGEETYVKPKDGETFESAVANINVGKVENEKAIEKASAKVNIETPKTEPKPISSKTIVKDVVKLKDGRIGIVTGYIIKNRKKAGVNVRSLEGDEKVEVMFTDEQAEKRNRSESMKGNKNAEGEHDYPTDPNSYIMDATEFNKKYGKNFDSRDIPIWRVTDKYGNIDMTRLSPAQKEYIKSSDHYLKEGDTYVNSVNYASGNIRKKLRELDPEDPQYETKKALLEEVCPKEKGLLRTWKEIDENGVEVEKSEGFTLSPITDWARNYKTKDGMSLINGFFEWAKNPGWSDDSPIASTEIPTEIHWNDIKDFINKVPYRATKKDLGIDSDDNKGFEHTKERNKQLRRDTAIKLFNRYLSEGLSIDDQKDLVEKWNDKANSFVNPDYTKIPVFVDGMASHFHGNEFTLTPQQIKGITQLTNKGTGLLAYDVGVGKTITGIAATVNQIQTGRAKKPLICVPKAVYSNWLDEIHEHFPNIKVNGLGNLSKNYWKEGMTIEEGTLSVCTYEGLENIGFNEQEEAEIQEDLEFGAMATTSSEKKSKRKKANDSEKAAEEVGKAAKTRDEGVQFSDLGFDHITVDEVHNFRNLFKMPRKISKTGEKVDGESNEFGDVGMGGEPSNRAMKLFAVTQLIQRHNDGRNTFLLSATPFQNSPTEIYSILSYMARDKLKEMGYYSLEQFISNFCKVTREYAVSATTVKEKSVVKEFENLSELQGLLTSYMDKVDGEEAGCIRPYKRMHAPELELTDLQKSIMDNIALYIEKQSSMPKDDRDKGYMFRAMNAMKKCALSPALVDEPEFKSEDVDMSEFVESSPKLKFVCDSIIGQYKKAPSNGQIMYMPFGVDQHPVVKNYLIKHGIPKEAIEIMPKGTSEKIQDKRDEVTKNFNDVNGKCKIIIGGEDIKEGVNLNGNTTSIYCCQLDWNPTDVQQLWGRGWRQNNKQGIVHCIAPLMHDSLDPMIYQKHDEKSSRTDDLYSYKGDTINSQDVDPEELKFALIKDPAKRASLQVLEFTEKNKSDQKMYGQLIDVLHNQIDIAFQSDEKIRENAKNGISWRFEGVEEEQKKIDDMTTTKKELKELAAKIKKQYKGKEIDFFGADKELYDQLDNKGIYINQYFHNPEEIVGKIEYRESSLDDDIATSKNYIKTYNKNLKKATDLRDSTKAKLEKQGMKDKAACENKIQEYVKLINAARDNVANAKEVYNTFYKQAVKDNEANEKNLFPVDELVKQNVDGIMNDLHAMDDDFKAKIKAENDKRFGRDSVKKSLVFARDSKGNLRLYIRKSAFIKCRNVV